MPCFAGTARTESCSRGGALRSGSAGRAWGGGMTARGAFGGGGGIKNGNGSGAGCAQACAGTSRASSKRTRNLKRRMGDLAVSRAGRG